MLVDKVELILDRTYVYSWGISDALIAGVLGM